MKLAILYFSGTGNTDYVARYLAPRGEHNQATELIAVVVEPVVSIGMEAAPGSGRSGDTGSGSR